MKDWIWPKSEPQKQAYLTKNGSWIYVYPGGKKTDSNDSFSIENDRFLQAHRLEKTPPTQLELDPSSVA